jgi:cystathionine beta-lyase
MKQKHKPETQIAHLGRTPEKNYGFVNPPVYHGSTIIFDKYSDFKKAEEGKFEGIAYARHGSPSHRELETALAELEGADKCLLTCSGVTAISTTLLALLNPGDHLLMIDSVYAPTRFFCNQELSRLGIETEYYTADADIQKLIRKNTKVVFVESPGSLTFEVQDIPAITKAAHKVGAYVVADNTWATPLLFKSFEHGVDVSIHSATKYIGGHSDFLMGIINCTQKVYPAIKRVYKNLGINVASDDVFLAQRGLRTLATRLKQHQKAGLEVAKWLKAQPQISRVLHPALPDCPGHKFFKRDFEGASGLFSFVLKKNLSDAQLTKFLDSLELFKLGYSWGGFESLIIPVNAANIRTAAKWKPEGTVFRISVGLENVDNLIDDLKSISKL